MTFTTSIHKYATLLSPIAGLCYVHIIEEREIRDIVHEELKEDNKRKRVKKTPLKRIEKSSHIALTNKTNKTNLPSFTMCIHGIQPKNLFQIPTVISSLLPPANKIEYQPLEVVKIILGNPKGSKARSTIFSHLIKKACSN